MPELPEVETIKQTLKQLVIGKTIEEVNVFWGNIIKQPEDLLEFKTKLCGQTIRDIRRRGKFLLFDLDDDVLVSHLRMEGRYALHEQSDPVDKHTHVTFLFSDGSELRYRDVRKFGTMHLFLKGTETVGPPLSKLGVEPLTAEFTLTVLKDRFQRTTRNCKAVLLDQSVVAGLGNIYVDEALFRAGVHPSRLAAELTNQEFERLYNEIVATLSEAVAKGGSTIRTYVNSQGEMGMFQQKLFVYGREGEACNRCSAEIKKTVVAGRGTHFCPRCQK